MSKLLVECITPTSSLKIQRRVVGLIVGALGAGVVWIAVGDLASLILALVTTIALTSIVELKARAAIRHGFLLRVFEDRLEFSEGQSLRTIRFDQINELLEDEGYFVAVLYTGERVSLPGGRIMEPANEILARKFRRSFGHSSGMVR